MDTQDQLDILMQGVEAWNQWRKANPQTKYDISVTRLNETDAVSDTWTLTKRTEIDLSRLYLNDTDLSGIDLSGANLSATNFQWANLSRADLRGADLRGTTCTQADLSGSDLSRAYLDEADLSEANLTKAKLDEAGLIETNLSEADLEKASLMGADLMGADLMGANLRGANLQRADLTGANLSHASLHMANLTDCRVHAVSAWDVLLDETTIQKDLIITNYNEPTIRVDYLEIAQFIHLLLDNKKIRGVIDTITSKVVLILGRFTPERQAVLDAIREKLRDINFVPIVFDFERSVAQDFTETIMTLASLSCFIIADITNPKSSPLELQATVPNYMTPFVPIIQEDEQPFAMFQDLQRKYNWVLDVLEYDTPDNLINTLEKAIVEPALIKRKELMAKKVEQLPTRHVKDYS